MACASIKVIVFLGSPIIFPVVQLPMLPDQCFRRHPQQYLMIYAPSFLTRALWDYRPVTRSELRSGLVRWRRIASDFLR